MGFIVAAALMAPDMYGIWAAIVSVSLVVGSVASLGLPWLLQSGLIGDLRTAARTISWVVCVSLIPATGLLGISSFIWIPGPAPTWVALLVAFELLAMTPILLLSAYFMGVGRDRDFFLAVALSALMRLLVPVLFFVVGDRSLGGWAAASAVVGAVALILVVIVVGPAHWLPAGKAFREHRRASLHFAVAGSSSSVIDASDKYITTTVAGAAAGGAYAVAYRMSQYVLVPVRAIAAKTFPRLFAAVDAEDWPSFRRSIKRSILLGMSLGVAAAVLVIAVSFVLFIWVLPEYRSAFKFLVPLSAMMLLRPLQYALGDALYALGRARSRIVALWIVAAVYVPLTFVLVSRLGAVGAVWSSLAAEVVLLGLLAQALNACRNSDGGYRVGGDRRAISS